MNPSFLEQEIPAFAQITDVWVYFFSEDKLLDQNI